MWTCFFFSLPALVANHFGVAWWGPRLGYLEPVAAMNFFFLLRSSACSLEPVVSSAANSTLHCGGFPCSFAARLRPILRTSAYHSTPPTAIGQSEKKKESVTNNLLRQTLCEPCSALASCWQIFPLILFPSSLARAILSLTQARLYFIT
jgi:hypothetical protein